MTRPVLQRIPRKTYMVLGTAALNRCLDLAVVTRSESMVVVTLAQRATTATSPEEWDAWERDLERSWAEAEYSSVEEAIEAMRLD